MRLRRLVPMAAVAALALPAREAGAQLGLAAGVTVPSDDATQNGFALSPFFEVHLPGPFGLRLAGLWTRSDLDQGFVADLPSPPPSDAVSGNVNLIGGGLDATLYFPVPVVKPYLVGGIGWYRQSVEQTVEGVASEVGNIDASNTDVGYNIGLGLKLPIAFLSVFAEARYYTVQSDQKQEFVPILIGVTLGK